jgi:uncharacterized protein (TIRG00374 family)
MRFFGEDGFPLPAKEMLSNRSPVVSLIRVDKKFWIGTGISLFFLFLLFRRIEIKQLAAAFVELDAKYLALAVFCIFVSYYFRALRWDYLLLPLKRCPMATVFPVTIIGFMVNSLLPARIGELARAYLLAEKENLGKGSVLATLVLDRLADVLCLLVLLLATLFLLDLPDTSGRDRKGLIAGGLITLALSFAVVFVLVLLRTRRIPLPTVNSKVFRSLPRSMAENAIRGVHSFVDGLRLPVKPANAIAITGSTVIAWVFSVIPVDLLLRSFGIFLPITASMLILVMLGFAVMVPATPGYVGTYDYACFSALMAYHIPEGKALSLALIAHAVSFVPVILAGFYYLWKDGMSLKRLEMRNEVAKRIGA